ncbi:MAG: GPW/gp25 family protein [Deltaproteobacteria bacterium]|jgi:hypothetical protein|nr:GPW/gp25 family protein [Deltaproteobacteria bacterium]
MRQLIDPEYISFPFRIEGKGSATCRRREHIRQLIEQVLFTNPNERVFRLEFGAGVRRMVFEGNRKSLWELARQRLISSLNEVLHREVDPASLQVEAEGDDDTLHIRIVYRLATINRQEEHLFNLEGGSFG